MKKLIVCLIFLFSFANAAQCYNGKTYVDIPESKLSDLGYTTYNITHSSFDCKIAYKRYLKVKEIEPVNVSYVTENEKNELKEPSKIGSFLPICLLVLIVCIIWIIQNAVKEEPQNEWHSATQKELPDEWHVDAQKDQASPKNDSVKKEPVKSWTDLSREYGENLRKLEQERVKNGFYEIPKPVHNSYKTKTAYDLLLERPEWKKFRKNIIELKGKQCEWCKTNKNLQVHHKYYLKTPDGKYILPWQYNIDALLVLCKDCHMKAHKKYKIKSYYVRY